jgi:predicted nucleotidyltransferase
MFINSSKKVFGNNLKAIVLFGSPSGMARKYSDYDLLIIAEKLPSDWRKRDNLVLELDRHGISDILLYNEKKIEDAINSVNPIMMNIFDHPIKIIHGKSCIDGLFHFF